MYMYNRLKDFLLKGDKPDNKNQVYYIVTTPVSCATHVLQRNILLQGGSFSIVSNR